MGADAPNPGSRSRAGSTTRRRVVAGLLAWVAAGSAACGRPAVLDSEAVEARIRARVEDAHPVEVEAVDCPDEIPVEDGGRFRCTVTIDAGSDGGAGSGSDTGHEVVELVVEVRQVDGDGRLDVTPTAALLVAAEVETDIVDVLADRFEREDATVDCPGPEVRVEPPDATFECEARDGDDVRTVVVRVRDERGGLTYSLG